MIITITTPTDFKGQLVDQLPSSFGILWQGPSEVKSTSKNTKSITWNVDLKAGETKDFIYEFQSPKVTPIFYSMGKAALIQNNQIIFKEKLPWDIVVGGSLN